MKRLTIATAPVDRRTGHERRYQPLELTGPFPGQQQEDMLAAFLERISPKATKGLELTEAEQHLAYTMFRAAWADCYLHQLRLRAEQAKRERAS